MGSVTGAGVAEITNQLEYDDEVAHHAEQKLYDLARGHDDRPWCLTVSFTHPHDPYVARRRFWDLYEDCAYLAPEVGTIPYEDHDPHSKRIFDANDWRNFEINERDIARARRGYFANISYIDSQIGRLLQVLDDTRQDALILFVSDHGDMLGERGLWFKMNFFEGSSRVPLMIAGDGFAPGLYEMPVSTLDVAPTLCDAAGVEMGEVAPWVEGVSLLPVIYGEDRGAVPMEYMAEGSIAPMVALREGHIKMTRCPVDPDQLFDLSADPHELENRAGDGGDAEARLSAEIDRRWNLAALDAEVRASQARRLVVYEALRNGAYYPWDYQPLRVASERYMRNHMDLNVLEESQRFPRGD
jgi:choline-sulfatase